MVYMDVNWRDLPSESYAADDDVEVEAVGTLRFLFAGTSGASWSRDGEVTSSEVTSSAGAGVKACSGS